jgi:hypothetical protein
MLGGSDRSQNLFIRDRSSLGGRDFEIRNGSRVNRIGREALTVPQKKYCLGQLGLL